MAIYGLRVRALDQIVYYRSEADFVAGNKVIIESDQGLVLAQIVNGPLTVLKDVEEADLQEIVRAPNNEDEEIARKNEEIRIIATSFCKRCIAERKLDMKLVDVEVFFDRSKFIFYFTAPNRIDFRELVKDLVREYRVRIELRQIGVRHETQMIGAIGNCGLICCCRNHLHKFAPVTIKMAKEQNLFLNPANISGICGRLLCCLSYEQENYEKFHHSSPRPGKKYNTDKGIVKILRVNMFKNSVTVLMENNEEAELGLEEWKAISPVRHAKDSSQHDENAAAEHSEEHDARGE